MSRIENGTSEYDSSVPISQLRLLGFQYFKVEGLSKRTNIIGHDDWGPSQDSDRGASNISPLRLEIRCEGWTVCSFVFCDLFVSVCRSWQSDVCFDHR